jgi:hypothetical protein
MTKILVLVLLVVAGCSGQTKKKGLTLTATPHSATLNWTQTGTITSNNVYRGTASGQETLLISLSTPATTYTDTAVTAGTTYYYEVTALNSAAAVPESPRSNEVSGTIPNPQTPAAPVLANPTVVSTTAPCVPSGYEVWKSVPLAAQAGNFEIQMDVTPSASDENSVILLGPVASTSFTQDYAYLRFWTTGVIQALNGATYEAVNAVPYTGGSSYHLTIDVNKAASTYSAYVGTTTRTAVAYNYGFHSGTSTSPVAFLTLYDYSPSASIETACNTTILTYPLAS